MQPVRMVDTIIISSQKIILIVIYHLSAPSPGDDLQPKSAIRLHGQNCTQRLFEGFFVRPPTLDSCRF